MLPYDGVPEEAAEPAASSSSTRLNAATARATTSAWQWDAQWGLYFNCETKQWAKPLPDGTWEYADAVRTTDDDLPRRKKKPRRRMDRDDPEQEDEKFDPFAVPEEQIWPGTDNDDDDDDEDDERTTTGDPYANAPLLRLVVADPRPDPTVLPPAYKVASIDPGDPVSIGRDKSNSPCRNRTRPSFGPSSIPIPIPRPKEWRVKDKGTGLLWIMRVRMGLW